MTDQLDLRSLQIVAAVAETGSMLEASQRYGITQSAVSQAVRRAEAATGVTLLDRSRRPLKATRAGRILANRFHDINRDFGSLLDALRAAAMLPERVDLRLGLVDSYAGTVGAHLVKELATGSMALSLTAWSGLAGSHAEALVRHTIDAAITCDAMEDLDDIERIPFYREPYLLVAPRNLAAELGELELGKILERCRLVRHSERSYVGAQVERHLNRLAIRAPRAFEFDTSDSLIAMVSIGMGVAITTPLCLLQGIAHAANVAVLPLPGPGFSRELLLVTRRGDLSSLAPRIADIARSTISAQAMPRISTLVPWFTAAS
ncbi:LysR family transcriptional regulator [Bradyrhizobium erythrophlei]|jgi:DNA-binding transcriptional LysR family regulator|uniref:DNA-binding transcriptional regulator, LysR family n=1 Tax=Bradyrhizobium erythrophlei TaxID=1437360 RepID=A0A1M7TDH2_9BRAD|nr:LysR family transcriptional regulator [Bradyrhizobium erythrophlei]SHN68711.1 DNA-binding transcriptional regulator, LysR family [Bradyrhizobium erythrophlei]